TTRASSSPPILWLERSSAVLSKQHDCRPHSRARTSDPKTHWRAFARSRQYWSTRLPVSLSRISFSRELVDVRAWCSCSAPLARLANGLDGPRRAMCRCLSCLRKWMPCRQRSNESYHGVTHLLAGLNGERHTPSVRRMG